MKTKLFSVAVLLAAFATPSLAEESVTVVSWGGAYQDSAGELAAIIEDGARRIDDEALAGLHDLCVLVAEPVDIRLEDFLAQQLGRGVVAVV